MARTNLSGAAARSVAVLFACLAAVAISQCTTGEFEGFEVTAGPDTYCTLLDSSVSDPVPASATGLPACCGTCPAGTYNEHGTGPCTKCPAGSAQPQAGQGYCEACPPGKYSPDPAEASCRGCPAHTYSSVYNATECSTCADNMVPNYWNTTCICAAGYYSNPGHGCVECPVGADCSSEGNTLASLTAGPGFYRVENMIVECPIAESCIGNNFCAYGYQGFMCHSCQGQFGWSEYELKQSCSYCESSRFAFICAIILGCVIIAIGVAIWVAITYSAKPKLYFIVPLTIFMSMAQVNFLVATRKSAYADWFSDNFLLYCRYIASIRPTILGIHCLFNDWTPHSIYIQGMFMIFFPPAIAFLGAVFAKGYLDRHPVMYKLGDKVYRTPGFGGILATCFSCVWFILYPDAVWQAFLMWDCTKTGSTDVLTYDSSIYCNKASYKVASVMLGITLLACLPVMHVITGLSKKSMRQAAILVSQGYKESHYMWYWMVFVRKLAIAGVMAFVEHENHRLLGVCLILLFSLCMQGYCHPYVHDGHNLLELVSLSILFVSFYFRIFFFSTLTTANVRLGMTSFIASLLIILGVMFIVYVYRYWVKHAAEIAEEEQAALDNADAEEAAKAAGGANPDDSSDSDGGTAKPLPSKIGPSANGSGNGSGREESSSQAPGQSRRGSTRPGDVEMEPAGATSPKHKIVIHF